MENTTVRDFVEALSEKTPTPGGGGAAALAGALGAALASMVGNYTKGKQSYAAYEADIENILSKAESLRKKLVSCIEEDAIAFEPLSRAYGIPKNEPGRDGILESCLRDAAAVPLHILRLSAEAVKLHAELEEKGSRLMLSDVATGAALCKAALLGAAANVRVNTKLMKDREYAAKMEEEAVYLVEKYGKTADEIYERIYNAG